MTTDHDLTGKARKWAAIGAALSALAIILGAFGAHALKGAVSQYSLEVYEKGAFYHLIHSVSLLLIAALCGARLLGAASLMWVGRLFLIGILIFSGSLYLLAATGVKWLGAITPVGGTAFILGWILLAIRLWKGGR
ncbi:MAG: DUF423 domain-containing protein [Deltaproteobacteria bacterium]|nr:DUF423 domain-containing protein [Deltaproteobacteria bacterium]